VFVLLDLDGTLVDRNGAFDLWVEQFVQDRRLDAAARRWLEATDRALPERGAFFDAVVDYLGVAEDPRRLWARYRAVMPGLTQPFPGVLDGLRALREAGWRTGVVSNGRTDNQVGKLRATGIADLVDGWWVSDGVGVRKPQRGIFDAAIAGLAADRTRTWMLGDDPILDIGGGKAADLHTLWISHGRDWDHPDFFPDAVSWSSADAFSALLDIE